MPEIYNPEPKGKWVSQASGLFDKHWLKDFAGDISYNGVYWEKYSYDRWMVFLTNKVLYPLALLKLKEDALGFKKGDIIEVFLEPPYYRKWKGSGNPKIKRKKVRRKKIQRC
jgi:hypothetical protein